MLMDIERSAIRQMHIGAEWPEKHKTFTLNGWHIYHYSDYHSSGYAGSPSGHLYIGQPGKNTDWEENKAGVFICNIMNRYTSASSGDCSRI